MKLKFLDSGVYYVRGPQFDRSILLLSINLWQPALTCKGLVSPLCGVSLIHVPSIAGLITSFGLLQKTLQAEVNL